MMMTMTHLYMYVIYCCSEVLEDGLVGHVEISTLYTFRLTEIHSRTIIVRCVYFTGSSVLIYSKGKLKISKL